MNTKVLLICLVIFLVSLTRIFPHPPNFTPILALAIFGGIYFPNKISALILPVTVMFLSDLIIGFHSQMYAVYGSIILLSLLGNMVKTKNIKNLAITGFSGSIIFFITTNFSVWLSGGLYPLTFDGLIQCYIMAIPFFHNTLISTLLFLSILFFSYNFAEKKFQVLKKI
ncbi:MAG: hypothetical protein CMI94_00795 [Pelagibacteraceae bacterium]|nr:hypothetical protein [Pelagibacteraceae bacterium]|tara:strand:+ start:1503 stop:2009 length:507 start_codon:yes stop_codon:yes gene_type:complete